ncbi:MAG: heat-inducible transcriptional repressor HrcA, partial [Alphaproteobacteria bacterium]
MKPASASIIGELNERSREVFREIVSNYLSTGEPTGSRTLSRRLLDPLSPATVRNVMADLEDMGLLYAPHTSAGRMPTEAGLRLFVDGLLEIGNLTDDERENIESQCAAAGKSVNEALEEATSALSGLAGCTGLVIAPKLDRALRHTEFVNLGGGKALVVMVAEDGFVENRVIDLPNGTPAAALVQATNYLNARLLGRTIDEARGEILAEIEGQRAQLDALTSKVVQAGLATSAGEGPE